MNFDLSDLPECKVYFMIISLFIVIIKRRETHVNDGITNFAGVVQGKQVFQPKISILLLVL